MPAVPRSGESASLDLVISLTLRRVCRMGMRKGEAVPEGCDCCGHDAEDCGMLEDGWVSDAQLARGRRRVLPDRARTCSASCASTRSASWCDDADGRGGGGRGAGAGRTSPTSSETCIPAVRRASQVSSGSRLACRSRTRRVSPGRQADACRRLSPRVASKSTCPSDTCEVWFSEPSARRRAF